MHNIMAESGSAIALEARSPACRTMRMALCPMLQGLQGPCLTKSDIYLLLCTCLTNWFSIATVLLEIFPRLLLQRCPLKLKLLKCCPRKFMRSIEVQLHVTVVHLANACLLRQSVKPWQKPVLKENAQLSCPSATQSLKASKILRCVSTSGRADCSHSCSVTAIPAAFSRQMLLHMQSGPIRSLNPAAERVLIEN